MPVEEYLSGLVEWTNIREGAVNGALFSRAISIRELVILRQGHAINTVYVGAAKGLGNGAHGNENHRQGKKQEYGYPYYFPFHTNLPNPVAQKGRMS